VSPFQVRHLLPLTRQRRELAADERRFRLALPAIRRRLADDVVDETALPSYSHRNPLMRYLFWERLAVALEWIDGLDPCPSSILDFGCGMGLLFPALERRGISVLAFDIHPEVPTTGVELLGAQGVRVLDRENGLVPLADGSVGAILVLDVLEHVADARPLSKQFRRVLDQKGRLLCSLPTENWLYGIGRRLAGFSGSYHVHDPRGAAEQLGSHLHVRKRWRLYSFAPFFDFFEAHV
jgi:SAM-dependent methyltransferase